MKSYSYFYWVGMTFIFSLKGFSTSSIWEKNLFEGIIYSHEIHVKPKLKIHILKLFKGCSSFKLEAHLAKDKILNSLIHRENKETLTSLTQRLNGIASINGDYFISNGIPVGGLMIDGQLLKKPYQNRTVFAWGDQKRIITSLEWSAQIIPSQGEPIQIKGFNEVCPDNEMAFYTPIAGRSLAKLPASMFLLKTDNKIWSPNLEIPLTPEQLISDKNSIEIPPDHIVIAARGKMCLNTDWFYSGTSLKFKMNTIGIDPKETPFMIGGGPWLCRDSKIYIDTKEQAFRPDIYKGRHPRSAVGYNAYGDIIFVMVEGRNKESQGATLEELAAIMLKNGCTHAMNLDGGTSSSINFFGTRMNNYSSSAEHHIKTAFVVRPNLLSLIENYQIVGKKEASLMETLSYEVQDEKGNIVPESQIHWKGTDHLKVYSNGKVMVLKSGIASLKALVKGQWINKTINILNK